MRSISIITLFGCILLSACAASPRPIHEGTDACTFCKMTISDKRYASEIVTSTGKIYVFDDIHCMRNYISDPANAASSEGQIFVTNFLDPEHLIPADEALLFTSASLHTPMNGNTIALADSGALEHLQQEMQGSASSVKELLK